MAKIVGKTCHFTLGGTDYSAAVVSVEFSNQRASLDGSDLSKEHDVVVKGTYSGTMTLSVKPENDYNFTRAVLGFYDGDTDTAFVYRPASGAKSTSNPETSGSCAVIDVAGLMGATRNEVKEVSLTWPINTATTFSDGTNSDIVMGTS